MATWINTIVGIVGIIVGIIGLINIHDAKELRNNVKTGRNSTVTQMIYNGLTLGEVSDVVNSQTEEKMKPYKNVLNSVEAVQKILLENENYCIPVIWSGEQEEFEKMKEEGKINSNVMYFIRE